MKKLMLVVCAGSMAVAMAKPVEIAEIHLASQATILKAAKDFDKMVANTAMDDKELPGGMMMSAAPLSMADHAEAWFAQQEKWPSVIRVKLDPEHVKAALAAGDAKHEIREPDIQFEYPTADKPAKDLKGDLARITIKASKFQDVPQFKGLKSATVSVRFNAKGLTLQGVARALPTAWWAESGKIALPTESIFAKAPKDSVWGCDSAADSGMSLQDAQYLGMLKLVEQALGKKIPGWTVKTQDKNNLHATIDAAALVNYLEGDAFEADMEKVDAEKLVADLQKLTEEGQAKASAKGPAASNSFAVKGFTPKYTLAQRFAKTLPEAKKKPVYSASVISLYTLAKSLVPTILEKVPEPARPQLQEMLAMLPEESAGAIAAMFYRDGDKFRFILRVSADEIKALQATGNVAVPMFFIMAMSNMNAPTMMEGDFEMIEEE